MPVDQTLFDAAVKQIDERWPTAPWATAAAVYLDDGTILTGVSLNNLNSAMTLCAETGPICRAYTENRQITASVCVNRAIGREQILVLAPCGACQERLALWGPDLEVGVADPSATAGWISRPLSEVNPFYWAAAFAEGSRWPSQTEHSSSEAAP
jgi:cytidine deaminase